ncbi:MAG: zinc ribbon domain-containing protein [Candidatus Omnitrophica bacterium]|nr:zinc ribbon domain-containing protein [Candidatus Omnitrophota bacterium]
MPTYEYECGKCGNIFEIFQNITAKPVKTCPKCKGRVKRLIGKGAGIIFKGHGFYATDYKKGKNPDSVKCDSGKKGEGCKSCPMAGKE